MATDKAASSANSADPLTGAGASRARAPDWERIELEYRAGIKTLRQIADEHGVSHTAIGKRAKRLGWERDLSTKIQSKADLLVSKAVVSSEVSTETLVSEKQLIDANATAIATVRLAHRRDIQRSRSIVMRLLDELELQTGPETVELLEELGNLLRCPDDKGQDKLNDLYLKIISLPGRAKTMKDLGETLRVLIGLEREAFGLGKGDDGEGPAGSVGGSTKPMTDAERAVRLSRLMNDNPGFAALFTAKANGSA